MVIVISSIIIILVGVFIMLALIVYRWPAMIEEDPNEETYYEMGHRDNPIPVSHN